MVKKSLRKNTFREIKDSLGRYLAILAIVALGVSFFSGLKVTKDAMVTTGDKYFKDNGLYDLRLISTIGLYEENVEELSQLFFVDEVEGAYSADVIVTHSDGSDSVVKLHSMSDKINKVVLLKGRLPEAPNECLADSMMYSEDMIGSTVTISDSNKEKTLEMLKEKELTVVGICQNSAYANFERGNTTLGSGVISGFLVVPIEEFDADYFTEIYMITDASRERIYSDKYEDMIDEYTTAMEGWLDIRSHEKYEELRSDAQQEIDDAWVEVHDAEADIADAKKKIADGEQDLIDGEKEIADGEQEIADHEKELTDAEAEVRDADKKIKDGEKEIADAKVEIADGKEDIKKGYAEYYGYLNDYEALKKQYEDLKATVAALPPEYQAMYAEKLEALRIACQTMGDSLNHARAELEKAERELADAEKELADGEAELIEHKKELSDAKKKLADARVKLEDGKVELADAKVELEDGKKELADAKVELADGEKELEDAKVKLADAEEELADFKEPDTYVLGGNTNIGYVCFENDSSIVEGLGDVFPVFFFLVAALVCMTTMNRMIDEQRTQIGTMKALGYSESMIMGKYLFYAGSAALIGGVIGFFSGSRLFPAVIWAAYDIMYDMRDIVFVIDPKLGVLSVFAALACSMGATYLTLRNELRSQAADLIRPKAPAKGRRVFLEYIGFIWKRLKFTSKVSVRNAFRYKKRFFMMILGVGGCYGLLLTGFGIKDSITDVATRQFTDVEKFDITVTFKDDTPLEDRVEFEDAMSEDGDYFYAAALTMDVDAGGKIKSVNMSVLSDAADGKSGADFINFMSDKGEKIDLPKTGEVIINNKLARNLGIELGDEIILRDPDLKEIKVKVSGIMKNYVYNRAYINPETYTSAMGEEPDFNTAYVKSGSMDDYELGAHIGNCENVASVSISDEMAKRVGSMMDSLNAVVLLVIFNAGALAFMVMYNLTNINITERIREIATLKVLGFYSGETAMYVFRENFILTAFGCVAGLFMGYALHRYVMYSINVDAVSFDVKILPISYILGVVLTFVFALIVDGALSVKLEKIKMAESLKSVE